MGIEFSQRIVFDTPGRLFVDVQDSLVRIWVELVVRAVEQDSHKQRIELQWSLPGDASIVATKQRVPRKLDRGFPPEAVTETGLLESKSVWTATTPLAENRWFFWAPSRVTAPAARLAFRIEQPNAEAVSVPTAVFTADGDSGARWAIYCRPPAGRKPKFTAPEETDSPLHPSFVPSSRQARRFAWGGPFSQFSSSQAQPIFRAVTQGVPNTFDRILAW